MQIDELKKLINSSSAVVVMENNEPSFVVMSYQTYKKLITDEPKKEIKILHNTNVSVDKTNPKEGELEILDRINKEILALKDEIEKEEKSLARVDPTLTRQQV